MDWKEENALGRSSTATYEPGLETLVRVSRKAPNGAPEVAEALLTILKIASRLTARDVSILRAVAETGNLSAAGKLLDADRPHMRRQIQRRFKVYHDLLRIWFEKYPALTAALTESSLTSKGLDVKVSHPDPRETSAGHAESGKFRPRAPRHVPHLTE